MAPVIAAYWPMPGEPDPREALADWHRAGWQLALPAVTVSLGFLAVPAFGVLASTRALGEPLPPSLLAGMALILGGLMAVTLPGRRAAQRP